MGGELLPDLNSHSSFVILNNEADNRKYENVVQFKVHSMEESQGKTVKVNQNVGNEIEQVARIIRLSNKGKD
jgi:hypothetical protein